MNHEFLDKNREIWAQNDYYEMAEDWMDIQWNEMVYPRIKDFDFTKVVDLACGHGRNTVKLKEISKSVIPIDFCQENIDFCNKRFKKDKNVSAKLCDGRSIPERKSSVSTVYSFDALVHVEKEIIELYVKDIARVLKRGGKCFIHHSNYSGWCNEDWRFNPHARNYMTAELFRSFVENNGMTVISQDIISWGQGDALCKDLDCITTFEKK